MDDNELLDKILEGKKITPVYQPIVSLKDGTIYGYEALSRISDSSIPINIEKLFSLADQTNKSWELETLCRSIALKNFGPLDKKKKLFLNVNSNIIYDKEFKKGFTKKSLKQFGLDCSNVIFEITERVAVTDSNAFISSIKHYKSQHYGIAVDDVGSAYSGLNIIANVKPNIIKLDMNLVRDIDKDKIKQLLCKAMVDFCKNANIQLIAEGIETQEELNVLIHHHVDLGQGFFLGMPEKTIKDIAPAKVQIICDYNTKTYHQAMRSSVYPIIGHLSKTGHTFPPREKAIHIYETLKYNSAITEFTIVENGFATGFMTRTMLNELFGGRYGFSLNLKKEIKHLMTDDFLRVNYNMPVNEVSRLAMQRPFEQLYNPIVVEREGSYWGIVTIKDLLDACTKVEVDKAMHSNPLTGLPGNLLIEKEILNRVYGDSPYCITYYDIDNFKAYNDAYGFQNGDLMLALLANILKNCAVRNEFIGHIGGDDFIVICDYYEGDLYCHKVIKEFSSRVTSLYRADDIKNGYIISKNRHGVTENFPITSLSIAGISNKEITYQDIGEFSKDIAKLKKKCKRQTGNYYEILKRCST